MKTKRKIRIDILNVFLILVALSIFIYIYIRAENFISGPNVTIEYPEANQTENQNFTIKGKVKNTNFISINDQRIYPESTGNFEHDINLPIGYAIIEIYVRDRHAQTEVINLPLFIE